jgi:hypothetical protein
VEKGLSVFQKRGFDRSFPRSPLAQIRSSRPWFFNSISFLKEEQSDAMA